MRPRPMTRRTLLAAGAGAAAAKLLTGPAATALAALGPQAPRIGETAVGTLAPGAVHTIALPESVDLVGLQWRGARSPGLQLRFAPGAHTSFGPWMSADGRGHGPDGATAEAGGAAAPGEPVGEPLWT